MSQKPAQNASVQVPVMFESMDWTGEAYREFIRDWRQVCIKGERITDLPSIAMFKALVDRRACRYDMQHEAGTSQVVADISEGVSQKNTTSVSARGSFPGASADAVRKGRNYHADT